jgi:Tfp pilus assembly protein PilN
VITINLLVHGQAARRSVRSRLNAVLLLIVCLALAGYWSYLREWQTTLLARLETVDGQASEIRSAAKRLDAERKRHAELAAELATINRILGDRQTSAEVFDAISRSVTDGLWLTEVKRSAATVQLDGRASSLAAIAGIVRNLGENLPLVHPPEIRSVSTEGLGGSSVLRFQVAGELAPAETEGRP